MNKKYISFILAFIMLFSLFIPVNAAQITNETAGETTITYGMSQSFIVVIPGDFTIDASGKAEADVKAMNVMIPVNTVLNVYVSGDDYINSWELIDEAELLNTLTYTIGSTDEGNDIVNNSIVLDVKSGEAYDSEVVETMYFTVIDTLTKAGSYNDVLTFTVAIESFNPTSYKLVALEDIMDDEGNAHLKVGESVQLKAVAIYSTETPVWETSNNSVVTVSDSGLVNAVGSGNANITYKMGDVSSTLPFIVEKEEINIETKTPGLYDADGIMLATWEESGINIEQDYSLSGDLNFQTHKKSPYYILNNKYPSTTQIILPDTITKIGNYAFRTLGNITSITIGENVESIGSSAFQSCDLKTIVIPDSVKTIGDHAFYQNTNLTTAEIGSGLETLGGRAFRDCYKLSSIVVDNENKSFASIDGVLFNKNITKLIKYPESKPDSSYSVPNTVTSIGNQAIKSADFLTSINLPYGLVSIGEDGFMGTPIESIILPDTVTTLGDFTFYQCDELVSVKLSENLTSISNSMFYGCDGLTTIIVPGKVTTIGNRAFYDCANLISIEIPSTVTSIGTIAFQDCDGLKSILYRGSSSQWSAISKGTDWNKNTGKYTITYNYQG